MRVYVSSDDEKLIEESSNMVQAANTARKIAVADVKSSSDSSISEFSIQPAPLLNRCFLFLKPHANTKVIRELVVNQLTSKFISITSEGMISSGEILTCFDRQYGDMGKKALILAPQECTLSSLGMMAFERKFRISWSMAVKKNIVLNARAAADKLGTSHEELRKAWLECASKKKIVQLGRDFHCGYIDTVPNKPAIFVINGFFMAMRDEYVDRSASVYYYCVEWDRSLITWKDFRKKIIGHENPATAHSESLRYLMFNQWEHLELVSSPDMIMNCLHASASAFEALVEKWIWLHAPVETDLLSIELEMSGVSPRLMSDWMNNISVMGKSVFDHMEDKDGGECIETAKHLLNTGHQYTSWKEQSSSKISPSRALKNSESSVLSSSDFGFPLESKAHVPLSPYGPLSSQANSVSTSPLDHNIASSRRLAPLAPLDLRRSNSALLSRTSMHVYEEPHHYQQREERLPSSPLTVPAQRYFSQQNLQRLTDTKSSPSSETKQKKMKKKKTKSFQL